MSHSRKVLAAVLCTMAFAATCFAQPNNSFSVITGPNNIFVSSTDSSSPTPRKIYAVDLNNDGVPDLVQDEVSYDATYGNGQFAVSIANGDGTFKAPVAVNYPPTVAFAPMAFGDFNNDGHLDIAMPVAGTTVLAIYLGKGDGTFVNPWYFNLTLASGQTLDNNAIVSADFGRHGEADLALTASDSSNSTLYVLPGGGNGVFQAAHPVLTAPTQTGFGDPIISMSVGDFDGDDNADIVASVITYNGSTGNIDNTAVHVLYGEGNFDLIDTTPYSVPGGEFQVGAADLDSDGFSDFYVFDTDAWVLKTFYGEWGRGFDQHSTAIPSAYYAGAPAVADFNDDGHMDLLFTSTSYMVFLRGEADRGAFTTQTWSLPPGGGPPQNPNGYITAPVAGDFNHDTRPDFVVARYVAPSAGTSTVDTGINTSTVGLWSNCSYPTSARGIMNCSPVASSGTTVNFNATAHSLNKLRKIELWVDGNKLGEEYHTWGDNGGSNAWFNFSSTLAAGSHQGTYFAVDIDNRLQQSNFTFNIPSTCAAPTSAGVHLCSPSTNSNQPAGPVNVGATATVTGTLARMEIWVDSTKQYTETNSTTLWAAVQVPHGQHTITVFAVNTGGTVWSQAATVTLP
ncbi:MAG TPA: FG-GAP-like repeat-containing protein [Acidobacteriaceae bacterium]|nr:FG-GAP-like repeat-containing protein [Acidobacteriaceae bacterium]